MALDCRYVLTPDCCVGPAFLVYYSPAFVRLAAHGKATALAALKVRAEAYSITAAAFSKALAAALPTWIAGARRGIQRRSPAVEELAERGGEDVHHPHRRDEGSQLCRHRARELARRRLGC